MLLNITQFISHASCFKINLRKTGHRVDFFTFYSAVKTSGVQREFNNRTQHLYVVASSIAELPDAFVSAAIADACSRG